MPDLGHEVKDFAVYHWRLTNWRKLEKKITSPEFECGGHRWYVASVGAIIDCSSHSNALAGEYYCSLSEIRTRHRTTLYPCILIMPTRRGRQKAGTHVPSSPWSFQIPTTLRFTLFLVRVLIINVLSPFRGASGHGPNQNDD